MDKRKQEGVPVLHTANDDPPQDFDEHKFQAPTSMRDVEASSHLWLRFADLDRRS